MPRGQGLKYIKIDFTKVKDMTLGELYGTAPIPVSDLNKLLWRLIKKENLRLGKVYPAEKGSSTAELDTHDTFTKAPPIQNVEVK